MSSKEDQAIVTGNMHRKFGEALPSVSGDRLMDRKTERYTARCTDTMSAVLHNHNKAKLKNLYTHTHKKNLYCQVKAI